MGALGTHFFGEIHMRNKPRLMAILNVTPDSFSDGGRFLETERAIEAAMKLIEQGADIIDIGGESTRPGAEEVPVNEELQRVIPVLKAIKSEVAIPVSIDTKKPAVMEAAILEGADMINDVNALRSPGALEAVAKSDVKICLMHMQGTPKTMQKAPTYDDVMRDITSFLTERLNACHAHGIDKDRIILDPGFGFGKTVSHNYQLLSQLNHFTQFGVPILAGISRKSMIGEVTGRPPQDRLAGSLAAGTIALMNGADVLRVHDVVETRDVIDVFWATQSF